MSSKLTYTLLNFFFWCCLIVMIFYAALSIIFFGQHQFDNIQKLVWSNPLSYIIAAAVLVLPLAKKRFSDDYID
ncbi:hypothetical protein [Aridibaculum aurantiacum]|uniref:hypothetical protein n=1 Tax=Aridibaculum aurantiacum TaxID=2810307 RepID=UPI001A960B37|nr:hypothetical protein [Aridibaculum aurantiacum]